MPAVLVLPTRISCENPGEIFILLRDEVPDDSLMIEFITGNQWLWTQPDLWNQKVWCMKALDFPAGFVNVNVYCEGVIKATTQIEYYTAAEEIECILQKVADPIGFVCQASKFSSAEKVDNVLTLLLKSPAMYPDFSDSLCKDAEHHQQTDLHLEELPTLLHCAAKFGLKKLAALLLQRPEAIQACRITNTYGENPAHIAEKYDHKEIQKIIKELTVNEDNNASDDQKEDEEEAEDDTYVMMMSSELQCNGHPSRTSTGKQPRAYWKIQKVEGMKDEAKQKEEEEGGGAEEEEKEAKYILEETPCHLGSKAKSIYVMAAEERPPIPPRNQPTTIRQDELFYLSPAWESEKDEKESRNTHGHQKEEYKTEQVGEEDPYTSALVDDGLYDTILANVKKERRKEGRSFIMNRPPAPAPRPLSVPLKEESTPYIAQVFQKKATGMHADNEKLVYPVKKTDRVYSEGITYTTVKPSIPPGQEELIFLQEQVKIGAISMDKALEKFKQWQNHRSGLEAIQQEKIRQLRDSIIRKRPEEESMYDKITIVHHPNVSVKRGSDNLSTEGVVYSSPFRKQTLL
ncbi:B-cell scaffold protein with ankyrin repeats isoform X2 [Hemicordylus capensis]|nr:B-cell scaffold protein with ankyrin repeats isoform X2 [Hemicordylus capensis]XP_053114196.1 B-cell scaffold protein with ankyrin repeats isoform X2 [Hemicordylus capensis]XP_053114197.1 B-cell scaffold protein with ankyrin repeats isoform X2 [Hemicordylus capensis]XP_053114198.1 B-cell scaffold protein with ankyrin repeats isoform X2 [Hemicordylus capensis]XP_053114199.1 B-cell scaffold protein with ankyrin repeats isoform X2 [Hemicordylus capensis]